MPTMLTKLFEYSRYALIAAACWYFINKEIFIGTIFVGVTLGLFFIEILLLKFNNPYAKYFRAFKKRRNDFQKRFDKLLDERDADGAERELEKFRKKTNERE